METVLLGAGALAYLAVLLWSVRERAALTLPRRPRTHRVNRKS